MTSDVDSPPQNKLSKPSPHSHGSTAEGSPNPTSPALSTGSNGSNGGRTEPPKRLRHWLIDMINSGEIPGLQWENNAHTIFRIPWKHAGKNNWKEEDCKIFKAWAEHRGKYKEGDKVEAATWKTRLRCALNKLPDIKELKELSSLEGNDPYRVYQLLPEPDKTQEYEIYPRNTWGRESPSHPNNHSPGFDHSEYLPRSQAERGVRTTSALPMRQSANAPPYLTRSPITDPITPQFGNLSVRDQSRQSSHQDYFAPSLNKIDIIPPPDSLNGGAQRQVFPQRNPSSEMHNENNVTSQYHSPQQHIPQSVASPGSAPSPFSNGMMDTEMYPIDQGMADNTQCGPVEELKQPERMPEAHEMEIYIKYRGLTVTAEHVTEPTGCRVHYGDSGLQLIAVAQYELPSNVFGPESLRQIRLVDCEPYAVNPKQIQMTNYVLSNLKRGLILSYEDGSFYAKRLCQSRVFVFGPESPDTTPEKLERNVKVKVFDYRNFCEGLRQYAHEDCSRPPEMELQVSFGQNWSIRTPIEKNVVTLTMVPRAARFLLSKVLERKQPSHFPSINDSSIKVSLEPDSIDKLADQATAKSQKAFEEILASSLASGYPISEFLLSQMTDSSTVVSNPTPTHAESGFFQRNIIHPAPIVPAGINDVEMAGFPMN